MKKIALFFILVLFILPLKAEINESNNTADIQKIELTKQEKELAKRVSAEVEKINEKLLKIDKDLKEDVWYIKYNNHQIYSNIEKDIVNIEKRMDKLDPKKDSDKLEELTREDKALYNQLELLSDFKVSAFEELTKPKELENSPKIDNPISMINGFSYLKTMKNKKEAFFNNLNALKSLIKKLEDKERYLKRLGSIIGDGYKADIIKKTQLELDEIIANYDIASSTYGLYSKKVEDNVLKTNAEIKVQLMRLFNISIIIFIIIFLSFILKYIVKKMISDNERYYMANKGINFTNFILILLVLLFSFLENVSYMVTVLGFASAGLAFAMKDFFMSAFGWMVIVFGGSFHVGDRIRVMKNGVEYVGDVVDISILRMTILEDVTLTTYDYNRRAGRIIFVPNNFIFTELLANYTHGKIKTVWDGIDFTITYDSNHKKASHLAKEIVKKYSKGYTDISRKQLNMLRSQYSLKNINVEPRIFTFMEENGIKISCWYMTNSYATLTLRSNIFANIIDAINEEDDIKIAYPTQIINIKRDKNLPPKGDIEESIL